MAEEVRSSEQIVQPETQLERELARAGEAFDSFKPDLIVSGVSEEAIQAAREHALARKRAEYEARQREDPLVIIANALRDAAQSEEEQAIANFKINGLEYHRNNWQKEFHESQIRYSRESLGNLSVRRFLSDMRTGGVVGDDIVETKTRKVLNLPGNENEQIVPSPELQTRILRNLGVLGPDETLDVLRAIPKQPQEPSGPYSLPLSGGVQIIKDLPTSIDGIKAQVVLDQKHPRITVLLNESAFEKVLHNAPTSPSKPT